METNYSQEGTGFNDISQEPEVFVIGRGFSLVGAVRGHGLCIVEGFVDGSIETADIKINESGSVTGELKCSRLDIDGRISGYVDAQQLVLRSKALIEGSITYSTISMESGAIIDGDMKCNKLRKTTTTEIDDMVVSNFSPEVQELIKDAESVSLKCADGSPLPPWVELQDNGIAIRRSKLKELQNKKESRSFVLSFDGRNVFVKFD